MQQAINPPASVRVLESLTAYLIPPRPFAQTRVTAHDTWVRPCRTQDSAKRLAMSIFGMALVTFMKL